MIKILIKIGSKICVQLLDYGWISTSYISLICHRSKFYIIIIHHNWQR